MIEKKTRKNGLHYFVAKAHNGQIIVYSEDYASEAARDNGIASLKRIVEQEIANDIWMAREKETKKYNYNFLYKDKKGELGNLTITVNKKDSEEAIAKFEYIYPHIVWRRVEFIEEI